MYTQTFAQTMTCADERTRGNFRIRLRKHCANTCANAHATAKEMSGCSARKAAREVVELEVERGAMDGKDLDVGSQIHIPTKREIQWDSDVIQERIRHNCYPCNAAPHQSHSLRTCGDP